MFYGCFARVCFPDDPFSRAWGGKGTRLKHSCFTCFWSSQTPFHRQAEEKVHSHAFAWCEQNSNNLVLFFSITRVLRGFEHLVFKLEHCFLHCFFRKHIQKIQNTHNYKFLVREREKGNAGTNFPKSSELTFPSAGGQKGKNDGRQNPPKNVSFWGQIRMSFYDRDGVFAKHLWLLRT